MNLNSTMFILVYTSISDSENSISRGIYSFLVVYLYTINSVGIYSHYTVFFHFIPYNMSYTALDMYQMILKHHETMPLSEKSFDGK